MTVRVLLQLATSGSLLSLVLPENGLWAGLAFGYHIASRLAYVAGIGIALTQQQRHQVFTRRDGVEGGFRRFRRFAAILMSNDALSFVLLSAATRDTIGPGAPVLALAMAGLLLIVVGVSIRLWAAKQLGDAAYYWYNFFTAVDSVEPERRGPYRFFKDPMYTLGYFHTYGIALFCASWPGLIAAVFDQAAILIFHRVVERPHFELLTKAAPRSLGRLPSEDVRE